MAGAGDVLLGSTDSCFLAIHTPALVVRIRGVSGLTILLIVLKYEALLRSSLGGVAFVGCIALPRKSKAGCVAGQVAEYFVIDYDVITKEEVMVFICFVCWLA